MEKFTQRGYLNVNADPKQIDFDDYVRLVTMPYVQSIYPALKAKFPDLRPIRLELLPDRVHDPSARTVLPVDRGWRPLHAGAGMEWTDDYSNIVRILKFG